ncbi:MAG: TetR/AcrR family transcriptional regulator [Acidimicrobiales bacterium]
MTGESPVVDDVRREVAISRATTERGRRTRRRLLDAAEEVFGENGYYDASITRIVERAGVAQGTFYIYFRSKQEVFEQLVGDLNSRLREAMSKGVAAGGGDRLDAEQRGFAAFFRFSADHPALYRVIREAEFVAPDAMHRHYEKIVEGYVRGLTAAMSVGEVEPCDPTVLAWALIAVGQLVGRRWIVWDGRDAIPDDVFEQCMLVVARMLGQRPRQPFA